MKVVHCHNIAGVPSSLVKYQRRSGIDASLVVRHRHDFGFPEELPGICGGLLTLLSADLIHYHSTSWIEGPLLGIRNPDARALSLLGKHLILHYHGDDLRTKPSRVSFEADHVFVSTPDLLEYESGAEWLPNPVDLELFSPSSPHPTVTDSFKIGYYKPRWTGTYVPVQEIEQVIEKLKGEGFQVEGVPANAIRYDMMPMFYRSLTLLIDKLQGGFYGLMACEAAACGIPVVASTAKVRSHLDAEPFFEFSGDLAEDLRYLLEDEEERKRIAERGRNYVENRHAASRIAERTIDIYRSLT